MFNSNTDKEWEKFGEVDPYYGVLSEGKFHKINLTEENKEDFFKSGVVYIEDLLKKVRQHIDPNFKIKHALDFGCGVGRLVIPLAGIAERVTGIDVSDSMLNEAKQNCETYSRKNVVLVKSDDSLTQLKDKYDFIHSFIVLQHIPVKRGKRIFEGLLAHLEDGGVCVIHFTYAEYEISKKFASFIKAYVPFANNVYNLYKGRGFFFPHMQMYKYDISKLLLIMEKLHIREFYAELTNHGGVSGIVLFFRKPKQA